MAEAGQVLEAALEVVLGPLLAEVLGHLLREFPQLHNAVLQAVQITLHVLGGEVGYMTLHRENHKYMALHTVNHKKDLTNLPP